jgi:bifunctional non-homologous end joining protein LigD
VLATSRQHHLEGVVGKPLASRYQPSRRRDWIKIKNVRHQDLLICGWIPGTGRRAGMIGSLVLGGYHGARLRYASRHRLGIPRGARWVEPRLVGEVAFTERISDGSMRHASWRGLRNDIDPAQVRRDD